MSRRYTEALSLDDANHVYYSKSVLQPGVVPIDLGYPRVALIAAHALQGSSRPNHARRSLGRVPQRRPYGRSNLRCRKMHRNQGRLVKGLLAPRRRAVCNGYAYLHTRLTVGERPSASALQATFKRPWRPMRRASRSSPQTPRCCKVCAVAEYRPSVEVVAAMPRCRLSVQGCTAAPVSSHESCGCPLCMFARRATSPHRGRTDGRTSAPQRPEASGGND
jgi:hypothetical protein